MYEVLFHHSNIRLSEKLERQINYLLITPRMHAIHHSIQIDEIDLNWLSGPMAWYLLQGTLRLDVPLNRIKIGVPENGTNQEHSHTIYKERPVWPKGGRPRRPVGLFSLVWEI
jgi:sterol desaturase/sphingolipid hydroxylase (fatty acid hydroxylase superfamily)